MSNQVLRRKFLNGIKSSEPFLPRKKQRRGPLTLVQEKTPTEVCTDVKLKGPQSQTVSSSGEHMENLPSTKQEEGSWIWSSRRSIWMYAADQLESAQTKPSGSSNDADPATQACLIFEPIELQQQPGPHSQPSSKRSSSNKCGSTVAKHCPLPFVGAVSPVPGIPHTQYSEGTPAALATARSWLHSPPFRIDSLSLGPFPIAQFGAAPALPRQPDVERSEDRPPPWWRRRWRFWPARAAALVPVLAALVFMRGGGGGLRPAVIVTVSTDLRQAHILNLLFATRVPKSISCCSLHPSRPPPSDSRRAQICTIHASLPTSLPLFSLAAFSTGSTTPSSPTPAPPRASTPSRPCPRPPAPYPAPPRRRRRRRRQCWGRSTAAGRGAWAGAPGRRTCGSSAPPPPPPPRAGGAGWRWWSGRRRRGSGTGAR